jgi:hypothetical protein
MSAAECVKKISFAIQTLEEAYGKAAMKKLRFTRGVNIFMLKKCQ